MAERLLETLIGTKTTWVNKKIRGIAAVPHNYKNMKFLITGAAGFIGSHLYKKLIDEGHEVIGIDNFLHPCKNPTIKEVKYGDIRYYHDIERWVKWADVVLHLAAQINVDKSISNPQETLDINITGTLNILEAVKKFNKQMVFASSSEVYGTSQDEYMSEEHPLDAQSPYAASKVAGDRLCKSYYDTYGTKVAILRNFNTFGTFQGDDSYGGVIAIFTRNALQGTPLVVFGDGEQRRDYMSVQDAISGYQLCYQKALWGKPINIGTGLTISINELAKYIKELSNSNSEITHIEPRAGEVKRLCANIALARSLGFISKTNFYSDLFDYVKWYGTNTVL
jgi:UDP-glucose 4-epimerase